MIPRDFDDSIGGVRPPWRPVVLPDDPGVAYRLPDGRLVRVHGQLNPREVISYRVDGLDVIARRVRSNATPMMARAAPMLTVMGDYPEMRDE